MAQIVGENMPFLQSFLLDIFTLVIRRREEERQRERSECVAGGPGINEDVSLRWWRRISDARLCSFAHPQLSTVVVDKTKTIELKHTLALGSSLGSHFEDLGWLSRGDVVEELSIVGMEGTKK